MSDLRLFPNGPIKLPITIERVESTASDLERILRTRQLTPGFAGKLHGRMQWASPTSFGRFGRAMLRAFRRSLNSRIKAACRFWPETFQMCAGAKFPLTLSHAFGCCSVILMVRESPLEKVVVRGSRIKRFSVDVSGLHSLYVRCGHVENP